ncbi:MAG: glycosyl hydrolase, partial [Coprococcus sp.]
ELYKLMYHYFVDVHELNNLLWVWNCMSDKGYPGDEYVDIISLDTYLPSYIKTDYAEQYNQLIEWTSKNKVAALAEVGYIPDVNMLQKSHVPWAYYMCWSREFGLGDRFNSKESLMAMYNSDYAEVL